MIEAIVGIGLLGIIWGLFLGWTLWGERRDAEFIDRKGAWALHVLRHLGD